MKKRGLPTTAPFERDTPAMREAIAGLRQRGICFRRPSPYQLKIGPWNFYPSKGTIIHDGNDESEPERDLDAFIEKATARLRSPTRGLDPVIV